MTECSIENCDRPMLAKGFCNAHYIRKRRNMSCDSPIELKIRGRQCSVKECNKKHYGNGYCVSHWRIWNRQTTKLKFIELLGGKCQACGGKFHHASFDFHHLDPSKKEFTITNKITNFPFEKLVKELEKCILLCANCHRVEHAGEIL